MPSPSPRLEKAAQVFAVVGLVAGAVWFVTTLWKDNTTARVWFDNGDPARAMIVRVAGERFDVGAQAHTVATVKAGHQKIEITDGGGAPVGALDVDLVAGNRYVLNILKLNRYHIMSGMYGGTPEPLTEGDVPVQEWYDVSHHSFILQGLPEKAEGAGRRSAFMRLEPVTPHITVKNSTSTALRLIVDGGELIRIKPGESTVAAMKVGPRRVALVDSADKEVAAFVFTAFSAGEYEIDAARPGEVVTKK